MRVDVCCLNTSSRSNPFPQIATLMSKRDDVDSVMRFGAETGIIGPSSNFDLVYCVHFHVNALWAGINSSFPSHLQL